MCLEWKKNVPRNGADFEERWRMGDVLGQGRGENKRKGSDRETTSSSGDTNTINRTI